jgi:crotonobetainyl-CoA:carnitine CoA-transferase CaiB-like acyl-CoA transferase
MSRGSSMKLCKPEVGGQDNDWDWGDGMSRLLEGVRVIEAAVLFNGDSLGMLLADLGADVIKVEAPGRGDYLRDFLGQMAPHHSPAHLQVNKNKRSVVLDLRDDADREIFFELLSTADVFVDGFAGDACEKLGIGYAAQQQVKPDIVYCQYSGFGSTGPYATIPTHGRMMNALAGGTPQQVGHEGFAEPDGSPRLMGGIESGGEGTAAGAVHAALHVAAALFARERAGRGCFLDASAADAVLSSAWIAATYALNEHRITDRRSLPSAESGERTSAKYQFYRTADDKFVLFCCIEPKFWRGFCRVAGRDDLIDAGGEQGGPVDFATDQDELRGEVRDIIATKTQAEWVRLAAAEDLPIGPAHQAADLLSDPHLASRQILVPGHHPVAGDFTYIGEPVIVSGQPYEPPRGAPLLGEHTEEILKELGELRRAT